MKTRVRMTCKQLCMLLFASGTLFLPHSQTLSGKVVDGKGSGVKGAFVKLANAHLSDTSGDDGSFSFNVSSGVEQSMKKSFISSSVLKGSTLYFAVKDKSKFVKASVYSLSGRLMYDAVNSYLAPGLYSLIPLEQSPSANIYSLRFQIGEEVTYYKLPITNRSPLQSGISQLNNTTTNKKGMLQKSMTVIDTVKVTKAGYSPASVTINSYAEGPLTITLKDSVPFYYLNPPNPCYNQFYVKNCIPGDPNSACGGNCTVANSCSPPEDASKANRPKTFICPRFMLFSSEMIQAAKDDAALYGWESSDEPPFNYGVVGHDPDIGGVDDQNSSCGQCYQIVYESPEPSSPQPPDLPYPKPLIVQSFNTAASGPTGFDVFMGAGGYGAFNSCYNDPQFSNTTKFNEFIYDSFPYQNPGSGGISFLRFPECIKGWPPTIDGPLSPECQEKIKTMCNQALVKASPQVTEDTRRSCIMCNQLNSLYHQNWKVMVKRVRCPDNLTRVTGCRLVEDKLPLPSPEVQTPAEATTNGTFRSGYHTTTMQDCCKPTCAWADWTVGQKLPVDGEWNSCYSCDKNGVPFTK